MKHSDFEELRVDWLVCGNEHLEDSVVAHVQQREIGWTIARVGCFQSCSVHMDLRDESLVVLECSTPVDTTLRMAACRVLRSLRRHSGIVVLSSEPAENAALSSLEAGADEFVNKREANLEEICTHIKLGALRSRTRGATRADSPSVESPERLEVGGIVLQLTTQSVLVDGELVLLTHHQWRLLLRLALAWGVPVAPTVLCAFAGIQGGASHGNLQTELWRLRQRLGHRGGLVTNVRGVGYALRPANAGPGGSS